VKSNMSSLGEMRTRSGLKRTLTRVRKSTAKGGEALRARYPDTNNIICL
jgi:hypothetical protein